jgi:hypothetical protein
MSQDVEGPARLSVHYAFVVHFRVSSDGAQGRMAGRVEHVISGQATHFASPEELPAFIARVLSTVRAPPETTERRLGKGSHPMPGNENRSGAVIVGALL